MPASMHHVDEQELKVLEELHRKRRGLRQKKAMLVPPMTLGQRVSDRVASVVGSWRFIIIQSGLLFLWLVLNIVGWMQHWDPYPFILLNLVLSFQAAYTAPIIMMSQNRQADIDRAAAGNDYEVNLKAELEIELLHQKIDLLREQEITKLIELVGRLEAKLAR